jgi:hypothetical protein
MMQGFASDTPSAPYTFSSTTNVNSSWGWGLEKRLLGAICMRMSPIGRKRLRPPA